MRDDIHKKVPRPYRVQQWVKRAVNDADRENGRSLPALDAAISDACRREISEAFRRGLIRELQNTPGLLVPLANVMSPRDLGSIGGHLEAEVLSETKRLLASGHSIDSAPIAALASALNARVQADIRATAPVLLATQDPKAAVVLNQMRQDARSADCEMHARNLLSSMDRVSSRPTRESVSADEDMLGGVFAGGDDSVKRSPYTCPLAISGQERKIGL
jgi:hypothetical protein